MTMQTLTEKIIKHGLADRIIRSEQLNRLTGGSAGRRYGLVNRAIKNGGLKHLQRGLYILADRYRTRPLHPFALPQALAPGSYISFETALSYHGWIPEKVFITASVVPDRKSRRYEHKIFGVYTFRPLALHKGFFLEMVDRCHIDGQTMLVAKPGRALLDLVCLRKVSWQGLGWITEGLRIDPGFLRSITGQDMDTLKQVYKHKRVQMFLDSLEKELHFD